MLHFRAVIICTDPDVVNANNALDVIYMIYNI